MNTKTHAIILSLLVLFCKVGHAQYQATTNSGTTPVEVVIPAGQVMQVLSFTHQAGIAISYLSFDDGVINKREFTSKSHDDPTVFDPKQIFFVGPGKVILTGTSGSSAARLTYKTSDNSTVSGQAPSNAVVIPENAAGPISIILESSTDLVTWTAAMLGSYGSSTSKRFFRVRAVAQ